MAFKFYDPRPEAKVNPPCIIINKNWITLSNEAHELLNKPLYVSLGIDEEESKVAIKPVDARSPIGIEIKKVSFKGGKYQLRIPAKAFIEIHELMGKHEIIWDKNQKLGIFSIANNAAPAVEP